LRLLLQRSLFCLFRSVLHGLQVGICLIPTLLLSVSLHGVAFGQGNLSLALSFCYSRVGYGYDTLIGGLSFPVPPVLSELLRRLSLGLLAVFIGLGTVLGGLVSCLRYVGLNFIRRFRLVACGESHQRCGECTDNSNSHVESSLILQCSRAYARGWR